ncbi:hypothetical protein BGX21_005508 [Mortierella sp. AD011]|nr:hypothetical protein BGX20_007122 [Mortierella sp. AD010]KAF9403301.1 hypothetical protein BGX21_005508 [Mortierella sp. AD011]
MARQPLQSLDQQQQQLQPQQQQQTQQQQQQQQQQLPLQKQDQQKQQLSSAHKDLDSTSRPISLTLSRFSRDCTASVVFCLQDSNLTTLAPWNSIYIPRHYRVPIAGQRQSSPGECDLVLKIFPRLALPTVDPETFRSQDIVAPCERCKSRKRDTFQVVGPDPTAPSPQRLFFSTGEVRIFFKICCPPSHHTTTEESRSYILTFELHHGKRILMSETVKNVGPGMVPEPVVLDTTLSSQRPIKRKLSSSPPSVDSPDDDEGDNGSIPRKRSTIMSLANLVSDSSASPSVQTKGAYAPAIVSADPSSPTAAVVPLSPSSYQHENDEAGARARNKSMSYEDHAPSSWTYNSKEPRSGSERAEDTQTKSTTPVAASNLTSSIKQAKKRQEPHELSELGIGQRASANLHAAYVNGQIRERSKAGLPIDGLTEATTKPKSTSNKPKPSHACPEPDCDKSFSRLFNLRSHMRTHSKARPFVCASCNFAFSRRHDRDRHAKKHLSEKPYKCIVCEATFVRQDALVRHLRMDGVQNQCMAAMEQRSTLLNSDSGDGYMLAAKQQAHDEQQQENRKGGGEKQDGALNSRQDLSRDATDNLEKKSENEEDPEDAEADEDDEEPSNEDNDQGEAESESAVGKDRDDTKATKASKASKALKATKAADKSNNLRPEFQQAVNPKDDGIMRPGTVKGEYSVDRQVHRPALSRAASPHQEKASNHDGTIAENGVGHDSGKHYTMTPRYEKGSGHQEFYGEDRYGPMHAPHPRSFYPSPSRSHSRSHSQSQSYTMGPEYHGPNYLESYPPSLPYHGPQSKYQSHAPQGNPYRDMKSGYAYPNGGHLPRYQERNPVHDSRYPPYNDPHVTDHYLHYNGHDSAYERPSESSGSGLQSWMNGPEVQSDLSELEPDKSICDAAIGLLRIRASRW